MFHFEAVKVELRPHLYSIDIFALFQFAYIIVTVFIERSYIFPLFFLSVSRSYSISG